MSFRPQSFSEFIGHRHAIETLKIFASAKKRGGSVPHILLTGPSGIGKTTIAVAFARELDMEYQIVNGSNMTSQLQIGWAISNSFGKVLIIDEIHMMRRHESIYHILEPPDGQSVDMIIVGTTTSESLLPKPMVQRFLSIQLDYYSDSEMVDIVRSIAEKSGISIDDSTAIYISSIFSNKIRRISQLFALVSADGKKKLDIDNLSHYLDVMGFDIYGNNKVEQNILKYIVEIGRPIGVSALSGIAGISERLYQLQIEPLLLRHGWITREKNGRMATKKAIDCYGV